MKASSEPAPRRPIEREYLATPDAAVPFNAGKAICQRARWRGPRMQSRSG